jgi:hypothetical protein
MDSRVTKNGKQETRRKFVGLLGFGVLGAIAFKIWPTGISKRILRGSSGTGFKPKAKIPISINESAVKRTKVNKDV